MKRILLLSFAFLTVIAFSAVAQRTVSGKVTDDAGETLPGVNVVIKGTTTGTTTDLDGNYRLSVDDGAVLVFSFVGFETQEVAVGARSTIDISMGGATELQEVVVTAQGIQREKRALGYSVASVAGEDLQRKPNNDVAQLLNGKVAGVNITQTSGTTGAGMNIIIRGYTSVNGTNQPLFIVDGVPFNTNTNSQSGFTGGSLNSSSRFLDLDPNNIAGIEVLKGLSASVLYGEQGRNGVVLITTKTGSAGAQNDDFEVSVTQGVYATQIASLPEYQDVYGNGFHQFPAFFFSNWGDRISNVDSVAHPYSQFRNPALAAAFEDEFGGQQYAYRAYDNAGAFFDTGLASQTSVSLSGRSGNTSVNSTISYATEDGFLPNNTLDKLNVGLGFDTKLSDRLRLNTSINVAVTDTKAPPLGASTGSSASGDGSAFYANILYTPRTVDLNGLPFENPITRESVYYRGGNDIPNPNWLVEYTSATSSTTRLTGKMSLSYDILDNLSVTYRGGYDTYYEFQEYIINAGIGPGPANAILNEGLYRTTHIRNDIFDHTGLVNYSTDINSDLRLTALLGVNARLDRFDRDGIESTGQSTFGFLEHGNFSASAPNNSFSNTNIQFRSIENLYAVYTSINLDYKDFLYFNVQARNDWSSTVESDQQSILYPSVSASFIPTTAFGLESDILNYAKVRVGYGTSSGFPDPYQTRNRLSANAQAFVDNGGTTRVTNSSNNRLGNPLLSPELQTEIELGVEAKMFNNRVGVDMSLYRRITEDLITDADLDPSTGFTTTRINAGEIENTGIELGLNVTPVRGAVTWDIGFNFFAYETTVNELAPEFDLNFIQTTGFIDFAGNAMIPGEAYGVLWGTVVERDPDGNRIVDGNGDYIIAADPAIIGDPNPDFTLTGINTVSWKGLSLGMQWDYRHGGDIFSITAAALMGRGLAGDTDFDREPPVILPGVKQNGTDGDGNPVYVPNDIQITTTDAFFNNLGFGATEDRVYDGTTIRLREISLTYDLPASLLSNTPFNGVSFSAVGQNLWFKAVNFPPSINFDTDVLGTGVGNGLGLDFLTGPSSRRFGGTVKLTF